MARTLGRPPAEEAKREEIISAALGLFRERGIKATTIREIAAKAGVTSGALYRHFDSKISLAQALFEDCADRMTAALRAAAEASADPREALARTTRALLEFSRREPAAFGYILDRHEREIVRNQPGRVLPKDVFEDVIRTGVERGDFPAQDVSLGAALIIGMCLRATFFYDREMLESSWEEMAERIVEAAGRVVVSPTPASLCSATPPADGRG
jgi:AcrR family transcriptional regulator